MNKQQIKEVLSWAESRGILANSTFEAQALKGIEEIGELTAAIGKKDKPQIICEMGDVLVTNILRAHFIEVDIFDQYIYGCEIFSRYDFQEGIDEALFYLCKYHGMSGQNKYISSFYFYPLIYIANHYNFTLETALQTALDKITKRTGKMENGLFVKDKE